MIVLTLFLAMTSSLCIFLSDYKKFNYTIFIEVFFAAVPGILLGALFLKNFDSRVILKIFSVFLIFYSLWSLLNLPFLVSRIFKPIINFLGGILVGLFGTGGPLFLVAMRERFKDKSELRTTIAAIFLICGIFRIPTYYYQGLLDFSRVYKFWPIILPFITTIILGKKVHVRISEKLFQTGISVLLLIAGVSFLL